MQRTATPSTRKQIEHLLSEYTDRLIGLVERHEGEGLRERIIAMLGPANGVRTRSRTGARKRGAATVRAARARRVARNTPKMRAARAIQGQYLGRLRKLKGADRARVKGVAKKLGAADAVKLADQILEGPAKKKED